jgi:hypothetical protein
MNRREACATLMDFQVSKSIVEARTANATVLSDDIKTA